MAQTAKFKFSHDEIHGHNFPKLETVLEIRTDLHFFDLMDELRAHKKKEGQTSIDIFGIWKETEGGEWERLDVYYNDNVKHLCEPRFTDRLYYYQMDKSGKDPALGGMWVSCGGVNEDTKEFYLNHFAKNYHNGKKHDQDNCKVIIVRGAFGNVAGRDRRAITESDIVETYNFDEAVCNESQREKSPQA
jgi:hypothetical protein